METTSEMELIAQEQDQLDRITNRLFSAYQDKFPRHSISPTVRSELENDFLNKLSLEDEKTNHQIIPIIYSDDKTRLYKHWHQYVIIKLLGKNYPILISKRNSPPFYGNQMKHYNLLTWDLTIILLYFYLLIIIAKHSTRDPGSLDLNISLSVNENLNSTSLSNTPITLLCRFVYKNYLPNTMTSTYYIK